MDGNAKHDLEHTAEKTVVVSTKSTKVFTRLFGKLLVRANRYYQKHFSSSMKALRNDGPTKELYVTPPLTKAEVKQIITACRENNVLMGIKKMNPDGEQGRNQSLHQQEKLAKNEIKYQKWDERRKTFKKVPILHDICKSQTEKYKKLSLQDERVNPDERYVLIFNKSKLSFLNEQLAKIPPNRVKQAAKNELEDINKDGIIDEKDFGDMKARGMNLKVEDLNRIGEDFGSCAVRDYVNNYCTQRITKEQYCEIREQLFDLRSHGACVYNDKEVIIAINSDDLEEYKSFAPLDRPIKEYGKNGARDIETESNTNDIIELELNDFNDYKLFKEKYHTKDFVALHNPNGKILVLVKETDAKNLVDNNKKKSKTEDLAKEADEFVEKNNPIVDNILDKEEEPEIAR